VCFIVRARTHGSYLKFWFTYNYFYITWYTIRHWRTSYISDTPSQQHGGSANFLRPCSFDVLPWISCVQYLRHQNPESRIQKEFIHKENPNVLVIVNLIKAISRFFLYTKVIFSSYLRLSTQTRIQHVFSTAVKPKANWGVMTRKSLVRVGMGVGVQRVQWPALCILGPRGSPNLNNNLQCWYTCEWPRHLGHLRCSENLRCAHLGFCSVQRTSVKHQ
jgi:hypothetical protein